jgi:hypothetical protein
MPVATTVPLESTFPAGAQPTFVSSAPPLPSSALVIADYPALDRVPPTNSTQVQQWLSELDLSDVPNYGQTTGAVSLCAGGDGEMGREETDHVVTLFESVLLPPMLWPIRTDVGGLVVDAVSLPLEPF